MDLVRSAAANGPFRSCRPPYIAASLPAAGKVRLCIGRRGRVTPPRASCYSPSPPPPERAGRRLIETTGRAPTAARRPPVAAPPPSAERPVPRGAGFPRTRAEGARQALGSRRQMLRLFRSASAAPRYRCRQERSPTGVDPGHGLSELGQRYTPGFTEAQHSRSLFRRSLDRLQIKAIIGI